MCMFTTVFHFHICTPSKGVNIHVNIAVKFSDDAAILGLLHKDKDIQHYAEITNWSKELN